MKNFVLVIIGLLLIVFVMIFPLPMIFTVSGVVWRIIIGLLSCFLIISSIHRIRKR